MSTPTTPHPDDPALPAADQSVAPAAPEAATHPDPITGEPGAHPVGVGVGALSAGAAGAAIGAIGGPIGVLIGAAIGAVAGGLAGKEVAASAEAPAETIPAASTADTYDQTPLAATDDAPAPLGAEAFPGEGFRATAGSGFADDGNLSAFGTSPLPPTPHVDLEDDALPMIAASPETAGFQAPPVSADESFVGAGMPASGEEAVRVAAYYLYLDRTRTGQPGDAVGDWVEAERDMMLS